MTLNKRNDTDLEKLVKDAFEKDANAQIADLKQAAKDDDSLKLHIHKRIDFQTFSVSNILYGYCNELSKDIKKENYRITDGIQLILFSGIVFEGALISHICWNGGNTKLESETADFESRLSERDVFFENNYWKKGEKGLKSAFHKYFGKNIEHVLGSELFSDLGLVIDLRNLIAHGRDFDITKKGTMTSLIEKSKEADYEKWLSSGISRRHLPSPSLRKIKIEQYVGFGANLKSSLYDKISDRSLISLKDEMFRDSIGEDELGYEAFISAKVAQFVWRTVKKSISKIEKAYKIRLCGNHIKVRLGVVESS